MNDPRLDDLLSPEERAAVRAPLERARTLPSRAFTSADFHALEIQRIFAPGWMSVGYAAEVAQPGDALPRDVLGMPLAMVRDLSGTLRVFHNVCPRDGCPALLEPMRELDRIRGPYHGWLWSLDGKLQDAVLYDGKPEPTAFPDGRFDLRTVRHAEWQGIVFVNLAGSGVSFDEYIAPVAELYAGIDLKPLATGLGADGRALTSSFWFEANWKTVYENFAINVNHEGFVHQVYQAAPNVPRVSSTGERLFEEIDDRGHQGLRFRAEEAAKIYGPPAPPLLQCKDGSDLSRYTIMSLYPNTNISLFPDHLSASVMLPDGPERTLYVTALAHVGARSSSEQELPLRQGMVGAWAEAMKEDGMICAAVQRGRRSPAFDSHPYVPFWESMYHSFSNLVLDDLEAAEQ